MTKADLVDFLHREHEIPRKEAVVFVELFFQLLSEALIKGYRVKLSRFGVFEVRSKRARRGRNPQTGQDLTIEARRVLKFIPSLMLRDLLNESVHSNVSSQT